MIGGTCHYAMESMSHLKLLPLEIDPEPPVPSERPTEAFRRLSAADLGAARQLAEAHREIAANLPTHSELRGLALRAGAHWSRLGALPRRELRQVAGP